MKQSIKMGLTNKPQSNIINKVMIMLIVFTLSLSSVYALGETVSKTDQAPFNFCTDNLGVRQMCYNQDIGEMEPCPTVCELGLKDLWAVYSPVVITDLWGLGTDKEALALSNHDFKCGDTCESDIGISLYSEDAPIDDIRFFDVLNNNKPVNISYSILIKTGESTVNDYDNVCSGTGEYYINETEIQSCNYEIVSNHIEETYEPYNIGDILPAGDYKIKLIGKLKSNQKIDWQIKSQGLWITDWAVWDSLLSNGLQNAYYFNETTGSNVADYGLDHENITLYGSGYQWLNNGVNNFLNMTNSYGISTATFTNGADPKSFNLWFRTSDTSNTKWIFMTGNPVLRQTIGLYIQSSILTLATYSDDRAFNGLTLQKDQWYMISMTYDGTTAKYYVNGNNTNNETIALNYNGVTGLNIGRRSDLFNNANFTGAIRDFGIWNRTLSDNDISSLYNLNLGELRVTSPSSNQSIYYNQNVNFASNIIAYNIRNSTLRIFSNNNNLLYNYSNSTLSNLSNILFNSANTYKNNLSTVYGNNLYFNILYTNSSNYNYVSSNYSINFMPFIINNQTYNSITQILQYNPFTINLSFDSSNYNIEANLVYNNTSYSSTKSQLGDNVIFSKSVLSPLVNSSVNITFYWLITLTNSSSSTFYYNSTILNQTVNYVALDNCTSNSLRILNITLKDEDTLNNINGSIETSIVLYASDGSTIIQNYSNKLNNINTTSYCVSNSSLNNSNLLMTYQIKYYNSDHAVEYMNEQLLLLNNATAPYLVTLYDLNNTLNTPFVITYTDNTYIPVDNAIVKIYRKYISENAFKEVESPLTDQYGQATVHLINQEGIYNFQVWKNNALLFTLNNVNAICNNPLITECKIDLTGNNDQATTFNPQTIKNIAFTSSYNKDTKILNLDYTILNGQSTLVNFTVSQENESICSQSLISTSGSLSCNVPVLYQNGTITYKIYTNNSLIISQNYFIGMSGFEIFGYSTYIMAFFMYATLILIFSSSAIGIVIGSMIGMSMAVLINVYSSNSYFGVGSVLLYFLIAGGIILYKLSQDG